MFRIHSKASPGAATTLLLTLAFAAPAAADDVYFEQNGIVIFEIESEAPVDDWVPQTTFPNFAGDSYYKWDGPDYFSQPGNAVLRYKFHINTPGVYNLWIRNRHEDPDSTEENDCWTKIDTDPWIKTYSNGPGTVSQWNWVTQYEPSGGGAHSQASFFLTEGQHILRISARSHGFYIDRIHIAIPGHPDANVHQRPPSKCIVGDQHCSSNPNSTGVIGELEAIGSSVITDDDFRLVADNLPANQFGYLIASVTNGQTNNPGGSDGNLCMGGNIVRFVNHIQNSGASGAFSHAPNLNNFPGPFGGPVLAGETWYFQAWYRDASPNPTSNFTNGTEVAFQ